VLANAKPRAELRTTRGSECAGARVGRLLYSEFGIGTHTAYENLTPELEGEHEDPSANEVIIRTQSKVSKMVAVEVESPPVIEGMDWVTCICRHQRPHNDHLFDVLSSKRGRFLGSIFANFWSHRGVLNSTCEPQTRPSPLWYFGVSC
jgi:hypothetical protein